MYDGDVREPLPSGRKLGIGQDLSVFNDECHAKPYHTFLLDSWRTLLYLVCSLPVWDASLGALPRLVKRSLVEGVSLIEY